MIRSLERVQEYFFDLDPEGKKRLFHSARELFNDVRFGKLPDIRKFDNLVSADDRDLLHACLFIFLNKTCFKGVFSTNRQNQFNTVYGYKKKFNIVTPSVIFKLHRLFNDNNVEFICGSYEQLGLDANDKILLYLDPLYYNKFNNYDVKYFD